MDLCVWSLQRAKKVEKSTALPFFPPPSPPLLYIYIYIFFFFFIP